MNQSTATIETAVAAQFANRLGWSDVEPFEVVKVISGKTMEIRRMESELDKANWKPEMIIGGFCAHTVNNSSQKWIITSNAENNIIRIWLSSKGQWKDANGSRYNIESAPRKFHDYNF